MGSPQFWAHPFRIPITGDGDTDTARTVQVMCEHVRNGAADPLVKKTARRALDQFAGLGAVGLGAESIGSAAFWWCKTYLKFVHHEFIIRQRIGEAGHLQGLISPEVIVNQVAAGETPQGDCAIYTDCIAAFLRVFGVPFEIVTVAVNPQEPDVFSHVFLYEVLPNGDRLPLDAGNTLNVGPGWQIPSSDISRRQVWDMNGNPVADRGSRFAGLGNYVVARGFGADGDFGGEFTGVDTNPISTYPAGAGQEPAISSGTFYDYTTGTAYSNPSGLIAPSQNSAQWASFATSLAKMGFNLAQINSIQPGTVVSANGAILRQNPGYAVPVPGTASLSASIGGGSNLLLIGGGLLAVVVLFSVMGKR